MVLYERDDIFQPTLRFPAKDFYKPETASGFYGCRCLIGACSRLATNPVVWSHLFSRVPNSVGLATHLPWRAVPGEPTENSEFFLNELSVLCGEVLINPSFWTHLFFNM